MWPSCPHACIVPCFRLLQRTGLQDSKPATEHALSTPPSIQRGNHPPTMSILWTNIWLSQASATTFQYPYIPAHALISYHGLFSQANGSGTCNEGEGAHLICLRTDIELLSPLRGTCQVSLVGNVGQLRDRQRVDVGAQRHHWLAAADGCHYACLGAWVPAQQTWWQPLRPHSHGAPWVCSALDQCSMAL